MPTRTEAIKLFLQAKTHSDLANHYERGMECQVNVAQDDGERINGEYQGRQWQGWTNGLETWKSFRIPYNAASEPQYNDVEMSFDLVKHAEGIGMTGWNWEKRVSKWVAYDFDAISGHSSNHQKKLTPIELQEIIDNVKSIPWVTIRNSTSGNGIHLYVYLNNVKTKNHIEHAALARAILGKLAALTGYDFQSKVDACGGNMWVWHRKMSGTRGLDLISQGKKLLDVPANWKDHIQVVSNRRTKVPIRGVQDLEAIEQLIGQAIYTKLDDEHKELIKYLEINNCNYWWDSDHHILVCHTCDLQDAHNDLSMRGLFKTSSPGTNRGEQNCYCYPIGKGSWVVRRFTKGVGEDSSWEQDGHGWTKCYLNREPDLRIASMSAEGIENEKGEYIFQHAEMAQKAALLLNIDLGLPTWALGRRATIKKHKDGKRIIVSMDHQPEDSMSKGLKGWLLEKGKWVKIFNSTIPDSSMDSTSYNCDDLVRHIITENLDDSGWVIRSNDEWKQEPFHHIKVALESLGFKANEVKEILGSSVFKPWKLVCRPFQDEYIGNRLWNRDAPQLRFLPVVEEKLHYSHWTSILSHIGEGIDDAVRNNGWAKANGIQTGAEYLKCWIASLLQEPLEPLPYLFLYGPQGSGKSILHEALSLLFTKGYVRADTALKSQQNFNGELRNAILCVVEETNLINNKQAAARIKDWVTSIQLPIHEKRRTPYLVRNSTHWIQTDNDQGACPVFPGDTRVVVIYVNSLNPVELIPKKDLLPILEKEAAHFITSCLRLELPKSPDRLNIPVVTSEEKMQVEQLNKNHLEIFLDEVCYYSPGDMVKLSVLYERFKEWLEPSEVPSWSKIRFGQYFTANSHKYPKGRSSKDGQWNIGNISFTKPEAVSTIKYVLRGGMLREADNENI